MKHLFQDTFMFNQGQIHCGHWCHLVTKILVIIDSGNGLFPDSNKSLPESVLMCNQWGPVASIWGQVQWGAWGICRWDVFIYHYTLKITTEFSKANDEVSDLRLSLDNMIWHSYNGFREWQEMYCYYITDNDITSHHVSSNCGPWLSFQRKMLSGENRKSHCKDDIGGLVQETCNSSALAMELRLSCTNSQIYL